MKKIKIDFISPPFSGHLYPLIQLAKPLLNKHNFEIRFITGAPKVNFLKELGFQAIPILPDSPDVFEKIANTSKPVKHNPLSLLRQLKENLKIIPKVKSELYYHLKENKTDIVIADFVAVPAGIICSELKIPWITTIPSPFAIETLSGTPSYFGGLSFPSNYFQKKRDYIARKIVRLFKKIIGLLCKKELDKINFKIYRNDKTENAYSPYSILGLGINEFEFERDWPESFRFIGSCCDSHDQKINLEIPFHKYSHSVFVTLGTHLEWAKKNILDDVEYLSESFKDTLFVVSNGRSHYINSEPIKRKDNVIYYEYIPYSQYLNNFDIVIHHGGAGITYNCIKHGKPCIVIPHDYDQFDFAARIEHFGIGIKVKKLKSIKTINALKKVFKWENNTKLQYMNACFNNYNPSTELEIEVGKLLNLIIPKISI